VNRPFFRRKSCQFRYELLIIGFIVAVGTGITGRVDAGTAAKGIGCNPRIIGQARKARGLHIIRGFQQGIFGKGRSRFFRLRNRRQDIVHRNGFIAQRL